MNVQISPNTVDVNVHPTKIEVRFSDNKIIYESVFFAVKNALLQFDKPNDIKFENKRNFTNEELYDFPPSPDQNEQLQFETVSSVKTVSIINIVKISQFLKKLLLNPTLLKKSANEASEYAEEIKSVIFLIKFQSRLKK